MSSDDVSHETSAADAGADDQSKVNLSRRYFLIGATSAVAAVGVVGVAVPFVSYWKPSAKARALGAPVKIDFSKLAPGEMLSPIVAWRGCALKSAFTWASVHILAARRSLSKQAISTKTMKVAFSAPVMAQNSIWLDVSAAAIPRRTTCLCRPTDSNPTRWS